MFLVTLTSGCAVTSVEVWRGRPGNDQPRTGLYQSTDQYWPSVIGLKFHYQYKAPSKSTIAVRTAFKYLGNRYSYGSVPRTTNSPSDCSGLVVAVYGSVGIDLPRTAAEQARVGKEVDVTEIRPGDLIFFRNRKGRIRHVGIYIGDFKFIHASSYAGHVIISSLKDRGGVAKVVRVGG